MKVNFEKTLSPCICNDIIAWHTAHGYVWNVVEAPSGRFIGVFFCTLLCGDGVIIHFNTVPRCRISAATICYAFKKALKIVSPLGVVYATVEQKNRKLIQVLNRLGFIETTAGFCRDNTPIAMLKYFQNQNGILTAS